MSTTIFTVLANSARDILPSSIETSASISQQTFFLGFFSILVELSLVQSRRTEERGNKDHQVDSYKEDKGKLTNFFQGIGRRTRGIGYLTEEEELAPEEHNAKEGVIESDTVEKGADNAWGAHLLRGGIIC